MSDLQEHLEKFQSQDTNQDEDKKERRSLKIKNFVSGTAHKLSKPAAFRAERAKKAVQGNECVERAAKTDGVEKESVFIDEFELGNDATQTKNRFKRFVGKTKGAIQKTGAAGVNLTKKAVNNTKGRIQNLRRDDSSEDPTEAIGPEEPVQESPEEGNKEEATKNTTERTKEEPKKTNNSDESAPNGGSSIEPSSEADEDLPLDDIPSEVVPGTTEPTETPDDADTRQIVESHKLALEPDSETQLVTESSTVTESPDSVKKAKRGLQKLVAGTKNVSKNIVATGKNLAHKRNGKSSNGEDSTVILGMDTMTATSTDVVTTSASTSKSKTGLQNLTKKVKKIIPGNKTPSKQNGGESIASSVTMETNQSRLRPFARQVNWSKGAVRNTRTKISNFVKRGNAEGRALGASTSDIGADSIPSVDEDGEDEEEIVLGEGEKLVEVNPILALLLHDIAIATTVLSIVAFTPTLYNWSLIVQNQIPSSVFVAWMLFAFGLGQEIGRLKGMRVVPIEEASTESVDTVTATHTTPDSIPTEILLEQRAHKAKQVRQEGYALATSLSRPLKIRLKFRTKVKKGLQKLNKARKSAWTALASRGKDRKEWQEGGMVRVNERLNERLLRDPNFSRQSIKAILDEMDDGDNKEEGMEETQFTRSFRMGSQDLSDCLAETLEAHVVTPSFRLRGIDVFLTKGGEMEMGTHPFLIRNGLRKKPTFLINTRVAWANMLIYLELPDWFHDFDQCIEQECDDVEVKAIKRFITGDDKYRSERLKVLPSLAEGPMAVRMLMPAKKEITVACDMLPLTWRKYPAEKHVDGTTLKPCLEVEVDAISSSLMKNLSSVGRRYLKCLTLDLALIVSKPTTQKEEEPSACLGIFRFHNIDPAECSELPHRGEYDGAIVEAEG